ncbi:hypothetical protein KM043_009133 [Ampulex compressa]|nr:hypothetical protein KM043_009133 [Ampulex compressa]
MTIRQVQDHRAKTSMQREIRFHVHLAEHRQGSPRGYSQNHSSHPRHTRAPSSAPITILSKLKYNQSRRFLDRVELPKNQLNSRLFLALFSKILGTIKKKRFEILAVRFDWPGEERGAKVTEDSREAGIYSSYAAGIGWCNKRVRRIHLGSSKMPKEPFL